MPRTNASRYSDPIRGTRTIQEAARLLGCGSTKVTEMCDAGEIDFIQVGNRKQPTVASLENKLGRSLAELEAPLRAKTELSPTVATTTAT